MILDGISFPDKLEPIQSRIFYKYKSISTKKGFEYVLDSIRHKYFYFSHPNQLNDPFDANVPNSYECTDLEIKKWLDGYSRLNRLSISNVKNRLNNGSLIKVLDKEAENERNNFSILSLCASNLNEILWGTYANSYSGICLGYRGIQFDNELIDNERIYYFESINTNQKEFLPELRIINEKRYFFIRPVLYDNDGKHKYNIFKKQETKKNIEYNIYHKKSIWSSENEFRAILINNPQSEKTFEQKIYYGDNTLCEILFGYNCPQKKRERISTLVKELNLSNSVTFYEVYPNLTTFSLEKREIRT